MKRVKRLKLRNLFRFICLLICLGVIIHDFYMLTIYSLIKGVTMSWTLTGFITFLFCGLMSEKLYDELF